MIWPKATGNYDWCIKAGALQTFMPSNLKNNGN